MPNFLRAAPVIRTAALTLALVLLLAGRPGAGRCERGAHATVGSGEYLQRQSAQRDRFERAAQRMCGPQSPWIEVSPGVVQCLTRHGKPSGRKARVWIRWRRHDHPLALIGS